jgi:VanZ family protein
MAWIIALNERLWPFATVALVAAVTVLSLRPMPELPIPSAALSVKVHHFIAYALLALPAALARPQRWPLLLLLIAGWGGVIEILQPHFGRSGAVFDAAVNVAGVAAGAAAATVLRRLAGSDTRPGPGAAASRR